MSTQKTIAGIDLGTTYSALAVFDPVMKKPQVVAPTSGGGTTVPSVVAFQDSAEESIVGLEAKNKLTVAPETVVQFAKRYMSDNEKRWTIYGKEFSPVDISARVLKFLKDYCTNEGEISDVVITVPAAFDNGARDATVAAAKIAGLNVLQLINEPTAAAIYYASQKSIEGKIMVYDLGGGTFDVTIVDLHDGGRNIRVLTSAGDAKLGGADFDRELVRIVNDEYKSANDGIGILPDEFFLTRDEESLTEEQRCNFYKLMERAEKVKRELSTKTTRKFSVQLDGIKDYISYEISRERFEAAISGFISQTEMLMEKALDDAKLKKSQIDKVILVGGSTRVPAVRKSIETFIGKEPESVGNVDEAVALGAAIVAAMKNEGDAVSEATGIAVVDVCNKYFGTICLDTNSREEVNSIILQKDTPIPCKNTETYRTIIDNQRRVDCRITECDEAYEDPALTTVIGTIPIALPSGLPEGAPLKFTYAYDKSQILHIHIELPDGDIVEADLSKATGGYSLSEIKKKKRELDEESGTDDLDF